MTENDGTQIAPTARWYLAQCKPNAAQLAVRNLENQSFTTFLPLQEITKRRGQGSQKQVRPLFPGYLFVRLDSDRGPWRTVNSTRGVARLVHLGAEPSIVPDSIVAALMARCDDQAIIRDADTLQAGDRAEVTQGPFSGFVATVAAIEPNDRIHILLNIMGQSTSVSIDSAALTPVD